MHPPDATYWISHLKLNPHPEGGHFRETVRSKIQVSTESLAMLKPAITSIYYLLAGDEFSAFHRLSSDEIWYFHTGAPLTIHYFNKNGKLISITLSDTEEGQWSFCVPAGCWFAAEIICKKDYTLVSCAVSPGFLFSEFELAKQGKLIELYPEEKELIGRLCKF